MLRWHVAIVWPGLNSSNLFRFILFADNKKLLMSHKSLQMLMDKMNEELAKINALLPKNKLSLKLTKTNFMLFKSSRKEPNI